MHRDTNSSARILQAALKLFSEKGYEGTSTREICAAAGITKPTLYYFFESKEGIHRALLEEAFQDYALVVDAAMSHPGALRERLRVMAELMFQRTLDRPALVRFLFSVVYSVNSPFTHFVQSKHEAMVSRLQKTVADATKTGDIGKGDIGVRMMVLTGALVEAISNHLITGNPKLTRKLAHSIVDTVLDGWQPSE